MADELKPESPRPLPEHILRAIAELVAMEPEIIADMRDICRAWWCSAELSRRILHSLAMRQRGRREYRSRQQLQRRRTP